MVLTSLSERSDGGWSRLSPAPPLMRFVRIRPSADKSRARPLPEAEASIGPAVPPAESRSAFAVSHRLDGLLRPHGRRFVAPCYQPWVRCVSRCYAARTVHPRGGGGSRSRGAFPATRFTPSEDFPSPTAAPHHCGRCLSCRCRRARVFSAAEAAASSRPHAVETARVSRASPFPEGSRASHEAPTPTSVTDDAPIRRSGPPRHRAPGSSRAPKRSGPALRNSNRLACTGVLA